MAILVNEVADYIEYRKSDEEILSVLWTGLDGTGLEYRRSWTKLAPRNDCALALRAPKSKRRQNESCPKCPIGYGRERSPQKVHNWAQLLTLQLIGFSVGPTASLHPALKPP